MSGKLCTGGATNNAGAARISQSKAFCEGIEFRAQGTAIAFPITGNPHPAGSPDNTSWAAGWLAADASAGGTMDGADAPCCAVDGLAIAA